MQRKTAEQDIKKMQEELADSGYSEKAVTISAAKAMILGLVCALPFITVLGIFYRIFLMERAHLTEVSGISFYAVFLGILAASAVAHELLHGVGWAISSKKGWGIVRFNVNALIPSCACKTVLSRRSYLFGVLLPFIVLGGSSAVFLAIYPGTVSVLTMAVNFGLAGADLLIALYILKEKNARFLDHPTQAGYIAYYR